MKIFFRKEQVARYTGSYSPSAGKPALVVADWLKHGLITADDIESFEPVSRDTLALAHDRLYVDAVLDRQTDNGFGTRTKSVADSLPYTTGSMLAAAEHAILHRTHTCSPTSGFHHAGYDHGAGFCTFNGLVVTAMALKAAGLVNTVGIVDCDMHYGDGTDDIIGTLGLGYIKNVTMGQHFHSAHDCGHKGVKYTDILGHELKRLADCDVILYQAGADPHRRDPLGGMLSEERMIIRDELVFRTFIGKPLAWNLAGGYQRDANGTIEPVLKIHRNTLEAYHRVHQTHLESPADPRHP